MLKVFGVHIEFDRNLCVEFVCVCFKCQQVLKMDGSDAAALRAIYQYAQRWEEGPAAMADDLFGEGRKKVQPIC